MAQYQPTHFLHGGDYNPDQWLEYPEILAEDIRLMKKAHVNAVSVGIFSWAQLEPAEGEYRFEWLDRVIDSLTDAGIGIVLATPSGARPAWMAQKYPEVLRCNQNFQRMHYGKRHNHCLTSPVYREKVRQIDTALAQRYGQHKGILLWHIGNEFGGDCYCPLCAEAFRGWLQEKYGTLEELNRRWWTGFWSQRYSAWSQIEPPSPMGEQSNPSMLLDWRRFETAQCASFVRMEKEALQAAAPQIPVTTNLMERFWDYDYYTLSKEIDVVSWDSYPAWGSGDDILRAAEFAMQHDLMRSWKRQPFILMESTPSLVNWKAHNKLKRPGMHLLSSMQAVAHGSQSVMMFQWRKGRGGFEAFHGAVVSHDGRSDTRVFRDVEEVGGVLERLTPVLVQNTQANVCILFDYDSWWAVERVSAAQAGSMRYVDTVLQFYRSLWARGISVDFMDGSGRPETDAKTASSSDEKEKPEKITGEAELAVFDRYDLVIVPMLFLFKDGLDEKLRHYVEQGGTLLVTFFSGIVNEDHLTFLGDAPHGLTDVLGLRAEEIDAIYPEESNRLIFADSQNAEPALLHELCEIPRDVTASVIGTYGEDFYQGLPCLTKNAYGKGTAWYLAAKPDQAGTDAVMAKVMESLELPSAMDILEPGTEPGVVATRRGDYVFLQNYSGKEQTVTLRGVYYDSIRQQEVSAVTTLPVNGIMILTEK